MSRRAPLVIGHRGAPGYRPEHTRSSYELALALGVDAVEPDVVFTSDGVLVVRHENEIGSTTDVADHPEFADRRTTKKIDGVELAGWFTEDFTWAELATLRCRERLPNLRASSASFDGMQPPLRLVDVLALVREASLDQGREIGVVLEIKHATYFSGLGFDVAGTIAAELRAAGWVDGELPLYLESFEQSVLAEVRAQGVRGTYVYLLEAKGRPYDLVAAHGDAAPTYAEQVSPTGLDRLAAEVDGISLDKRMILAPDLRGRPTGPAAVIDDAHARGLRVFTWTCRPENAFLLPAFRRGREKSAFGYYESEWRIIADAGVDGVFVDHPDLGVGFFA
ncbi:glycerophosphodiester phosphodiesterase family protein [Microbacterium lacticum]